MVQCGFTTGHVLGVELPRAVLLVPVEVPAPGHAQPLAEPVLDQRGQDSPPEDGGLGGVLAPGVGITAAQEHMLDGTGQGIGGKYLAGRGSSAGVQGQEDPAGPAGPQEHLLTPLLASEHDLVLFCASH